MLVVVVVVVVGSGKPSLTMDLWYGWDVGCTFTSGQSTTHWAAPMTHSGLALQPTSLLISMLPSENKNEAIPDRRVSVSVCVCVCVCSQSADVEEQT